MWEISSILCPIDFSESSEMTLRAATQLACDRKTHLDVLHVVPATVVSHVESVTELDPEQAREKLWEAMRQPRLEEADLDVKHRIAEGDPVQAILRVADETHCGLIVIGKHPKSGWARWLRGGVAETVIRKAPCPVLIVKETALSVPPEPGEHMEQPAADAVLSGTKQENDVTVPLWPTIP